MLANETFRYMFNEKRNGLPKLGGIFVGQKDTASPIIRGIHGDVGQSGAILDVVLYNRRMLDDRLDLINRLARPSDVTQKGCRAASSERKVIPSGEAGV